MIQIPENTCALIFDLDGTLADTMPVHYMAWKEATLKIGHEIPEAFIAELAGMPSKKVVEAFNLRYGTNLDPETVRSEKEKAFHRLREGKLKAIPAVGELAARYKGILPLAIGTGSNRAGTAYTLKAIGMEDWFGAVVTADDVQAHKPSPDTFLQCAAMLGVDPACCLVLEDAELGFEAAARAGMMSLDVRPWY